MSLDFTCPPGREGGAGGRVDQAWTPLVVCWSRLLLAPESPLWSPLPNSTFSYAILLAKLAMVGVLSTEEKKKNIKLHKAVKWGFPHPPGSQRLAVYQHTTCPRPRLDPASQGFRKLYGKVKNG